VVDSETNLFFLLQYSVGFTNIDGQFLNGTADIALSGTDVTIASLPSHSDDLNGAGRIIVTFQAAATA